ncbi:hypothetical protein GCM10020258_47960 [Sphingomonas yabuuchiae]
MRRDDFARRHRAGDDRRRGDHRPFLVVQSDLYNETHNTITVCPMTSVVGGEALFRVAFSPREHTGLTVECEVQVDKILSIPRNHIVKVIGHASPPGWSRSIRRCAAG